MAEVAASRTDAGWVVSVFRRRSKVVSAIVLGDTDDTSIYRDTKSIAILFDTFCRYYTWQNLLILNFVTLTVSVTHACMYQYVYILY